MITLKAIKVSHSLSEETIAFSANLYFNDKKVGTCSNRGCGGPCHVELTDRALYPQLEAYATALPAVEFDGQQLSMDLDFLLMTLVEDFITEQDKKKREKKINTFVSKHVQANASKGLKTLKVITDKDMRCVPIKPNKVVDQAFINKLATDAKITITNWELL